MGFAFSWTLTLTIVAVTMLGEDKPLGSLGIKPLSWRTAVVAIGLGILLPLAVPLLTLLAEQRFPSAGDGGIIDAATSYPAWIILLSVVTAAITEEVLLRAYPIERLLRWTGNPWGGALLGLIAFVVVHAGGWNPSHVIGVVLPLGIVLTGLYMWQRNLLFVAIVHIFIDLPLFFLALGGEFFMNEKCTHIP